MSRLIDRSFGHVVTLEPLTLPELRRAIDDDGAGSGRINECKEDDNTSARVT